MRDPKEMSEVNRVSDEQLSEPAQIAIRNLVREMPDESLSMAWRSGLNEQLLLESRRYQRKTRWMFALRPVAGLALAGAMAAIFVFRTGALDRPSPRLSDSSVSLEAELWTAHMESAQFADVAGTGVRPVEATFVSRSSTVDTHDWDEVDVDSL